MKKYRNLFASAMLIGAASIGFTSCGGDDNDNEPGVGSSNVEFRATLANFSGSSDAGFGAGDAISVWAMESVNYSATPLTPSHSFANNRRYSYQGGLFKGDIRKPDNLTLNYYAVYPYSPENSEHFNFSVKLDQSPIDNYLASDLRTARTGAITSQLVDLSFSHALCKVVLNIDASLGTATAIEFNAQPNVTCDLNSYTVATYGTMTAIKMNKEGNNRFRVIIPSMTVRQGTLMAIIHTSKGDFTWQIENDTFFDTGEYHSFDLSKNTDDTSTDAISFNATILPWIPAQI